jgi:hypothetical protein
MSQYRVVVPSVPQEDGSFKTKQTFYPTLEAAVEFVDEFAAAGKITQTVDVEVSAASIAAARERIAARKAAKKAPGQ